MNRRLQSLGIVRDERANALTEFAIVIPVLLLFFFAMLQYFSVLQASQLGNYAAYAAARVYSVRQSADAADAKDKAKSAAAVALAPIARPVQGEPGYGIVNMISSILGDVSALLPFDTSQAQNYFGGWFYAQAFRLEPTILGGSVNLPTTVFKNMTEVDVSINYPQPVFIPGLAGMWNLVTGKRLYHSLQPLSEGLTGLPKQILPWLSYYDQLVELVQAQFKYKLPSAPFIIYPYINVESKCAMGCEHWDGTLRIRTGGGAGDLNPSNIEGELAGIVEGATQGMLDDLGSSIVDSLF